MGRSILSIRSAVRALICLALLFALTAGAEAQTFSPTLVSRSGVSFAPADAAPAAAAASAEPHRFALGARAGGYAASIGFMIRYWFTDHLMFDADISHYGHDYAGYASFGQTITSFSILYNFYNEQFDALRLRIYAGGGINIATTSYAYTGQGQATARLNNVGGQGIGGVELLFKQIPRLGVGAELTAFTTHEFVGIDPVGGLGSSVYAVWYLK